MTGIVKICLVLSLFFIIPAVSGADETGKVLLDGTTVHITSGDSYLLYQMYLLSVKSVSPDGSIWLQLTLNDENVKSAIVGAGDFFIYNKTNKTILSARVDNVYAGASEQSLVSLSPVYQYLDPDLPLPVQTEIGQGRNGSRDNGSTPPGINTPRETLIWIVGIVLVITLFYTLRKLW
ncbi:MAG: S-layer protein domain-containing protein [Candidatus Methanoperedens sp.]|jgi:hypothetical protein|nr:S-layer protein domain-containing protein [Candidatus Methanoperedens sp.]PKL53243.1 MAG: hypothetical protein CVV36_08125 [Candidatus Methanoperedenaceae archaeon HGW-Methanoperedenaceae-1]